MADFPAEIIALICDEPTLSCSDLYALARACRLYRPIAEPLMYERPYISVPQHIWTWAEMMLKYPQRGPQVKSLTFRPLSDFDFYRTQPLHPVADHSATPDHDDHDPVSSAKIHIPEAMALCTNLIALHILEPSNPNEDTQIHTHFRLFFGDISQSLFPKLESFHNGFFSQELLLDDAPMARFLDATPTITTLSLSPYQGLQNFPDWKGGILPNLKTLSASPKVLCKLGYSQERLILQQWFATHALSSLSDASTITFPPVSPRPITRIQVDVSAIAPVISAPDMNQYELITGGGFHPRYPLRSAVDSLSPFKSTLQSLHFIWNSELAYRQPYYVAGELRTGGLMSLLDVLLAVNDTVEGLKYLRISDSASRYSIMDFFIPPSETSLRLSYPSAKAFLAPRKKSCLEMLVIRPCRLLQDPSLRENGYTANYFSDHVRTSSLRPELETATIESSYTELRTHEYRVSAVRRLATIFPSLRTVTFDFWNSKVYEYDVSDKTKVGVCLISEVDEEAWMEI